MEIKMLLNSLWTRYERREREQPVGFEPMTCWSWDVWSAAEPQLLPLLIFKFIQQPTDQLSSRLRTFNARLLLLPFQNLADLERVQVDGELVFTRFGRSGVARFNGGRIVRRPNVRKRGFQSRNQTSQPVQIVQLGKSVQNFLAEKSDSSSVRPFLVFPFSRTLVSGGLKIQAKVKFKAIQNNSPPGL